MAEAMMPRVAEEVIELLERKLQLRDARRGGSLTLAEFEEQDAELNNRLLQL